MGKYKQLERHLNGLVLDEWAASFHELERVLGFRLPASARDHQAWWANEANPHQPQKLAWKKAGWRTENLNLNAETISFCRVETSPVHSCEPQGEARDHKAEASLSPRLSDCAQKDVALPGKEAFALIACVKKKDRVPVAAKDLYLSPLFRKSRMLAEAAGWQWFILSAKYGLLPPCQTIEPYDETLSRAPRSIRREWTHRVLNQIAESIPGGVPIVVLAGQDYAEILVLELRKRGHTVYEPLEGVTLYRRPSALDRLCQQIVVHRGEQQKCR